MKVHLLEDLIQRFLSRALEPRDTSWYYSHLLVSRFHDAWLDPGHASLHEKYDEALKSDISQRWWKRDNYKPKEIMLNLIDADPGLAAIAFKDLSNDSSSLEGRLSRFNFYAESLLEAYRKKFPRDIESWHAQDASMISLYLAGWFPEKYSLYTGLSIYQAFCKLVGSMDIPVIDDLSRYYKSTLVIFRFLQKNPAYSDLLAMRTSLLHRIKFLPFQMTYEIILFAGNNDDLT